MLQFCIHSLNLLNNIGQHRRHLRKSRFYKLKVIRLCFLYGRTCRCCSYAFLVGVTRTPGVLFFLVAEGHCITGALLLLFFHVVLLFSLVTEECCNMRTGVVVVLISLVTEERCNVHTGEYFSSPWSWKGAAM